MQQYTHNVALAFATCLESRRCDRVFGMQHYEKNMIKWITNRCGEVLFRQRLMEKTNRGQKTDFFEKPEPIHSVQRLADNLSLCKLVLNGFRRELFFRHADALFMP